MEPNRKEKKTLMMVKSFLGCIDIYKDNGQDCRMELVCLTLGQAREAQGPGKWDGKTRWYHWPKETSSVVHGSQLEQKVKQASYIIHGSRDHTKGDCELGRRKIPSLFLKSNIYHFLWLINQSSSRICDQRKSGIFDFWSHYNWRDQKHL